MLRNFDELKGYTLRATDDDAGKAMDVLFDDEDWTIRYLVADTGNWLPGRRVLISPVALAQPDWANRVFPLKLTKQQVEDAPGLGEDEPVSKQYQSDLHTHYGWPVFYVPGAGFPVYSPAPAAPETDTSPGNEDPHLRSADEVTGYHILADDGEIGHVEDFIVEDESWIIRYMVVDTRNWLPGKKVLVSPDWTGEIDWAKARVRVELTQDAIKDAPEYDPTAPVNREFEERLYDFHGRPHYWE